MKHLIIQKRSSGFFSDFNLIVAALTHLRENHIEDFSFIWNNIYYSTNINENLFNKYFFKSKEYEAYDVIYDIGDIGGNFFSHFNEQSIWDRANKTLCYYNYFTNPLYLECYNKCFKADNCLGVHVRGTDHYQHGALLDLPFYFKKIDEKLNTGDFKKLFLATDEERIVQQFINKYGDFVNINSNITRSSTCQGIHLSNLINKEQLAIDVLIDAISLANCEEILITSSNVSGYTLCVNPKIKYSYIDKHIS